MYMFSCPQFRLCVLMCFLPLFKLLGPGCSNYVPKAPRSSVPADEQFSDEILCTCFLAPSSTCVCSCVFSLFKLLGPGCSNYVPKAPRSSVPALRSYSSIFQQNSIHCCQTLGTRVLQTTRCLILPYEGHHGILLAKIA